MRQSAMIAIALASLLLATAAEAGPKGHKDEGHDKVNKHAEHKNCPPGLAKKNHHCVPPGLAHKDHDDRDHDYAHSYEVGHGLPDDYVVLFDPQLYPFWHHATYVRSGDFFYLIDPLTGAILQNAGPVDDWRWGWSDVDFAHCPPGLAKKNPPCVPPGQARKAAIADPYHTGDHLPDGYHVILTATDQQGPDTSEYVRLGDTIYRVDRQTGQVLQQVGTISALLP